MIRIDPWKIILTLMTVVVIGFFALLNFLPNSLSFVERYRVNLGLDLQGGSYLLLEVDIDAVITERLDDLAETIRLETRAQRIGIKNLQATDDLVTFELRDQSQFAEARGALSELVSSDYNVTATQDGYSIKYNQAAIALLTSTTIEQAIEIVRIRIDETGTKEPIIQRQGVNRILLQLPGVDDPEHVKKLLGRTARLGFQLVDISSSAEAARRSGRVPPGSELLPSANNPEEFHLLKRRVLISGDMLNDARPGFDSRSNEPIVSFTLNATGAERFGRVTGQNIGRAFAIVLDDQVISAPVIQAQIFANGQISGRFSVTETNDLSLLLRAGALPAPLTVLEERTVGPGLGSDSIKAGKIAAIIGLAGVIVFMIASYGAVGVIAVIALIGNILLLFGQLSLLQATLTLPGIAGIVLTIGMAVDANVIIFERIKEELVAGRKLAQSLETGFKQATGTIFDANFTTLAAAVFLYFLGSGPIKGFSVTLAIGVISSMFSAVLVTRMLMILWINYAKPETLFTQRPTDA